MNLSSTSGSLNTQRPTTALRGDQKTTFVVERNKNRQRAVTEARERNVTQAAELVGWISTKRATRTAWDAVRRGTIWRRSFHPCPRKSKGVRFCPQVDLWTCIKLLRSADDTHVVRWHAQDEGSQGLHKIVSGRPSSSCRARRDFGWLATQPSTTPRRRYVSNTYTHKGKGRYRRWLRPHHLRKACLGMVEVTPLAAVTALHSHV